MSDTLIFAVPKGRILDDALPLLKRAGIAAAPEFFDPANRALRFATNHQDIDLIRVRAFDVATFVAHGAAHIGIVGSDVIDEFEYSDLYAPVDLDFGQCRLSVAQPIDDQPAADCMGIADNTDGARPSHVRIATKYPNLTRKYFARQGIQAECVKLNGAMELAPSLGLARRIVDLVESGRTLKENGLVETEVIMQISARLIVNRAALKMNYARLGPLVNAFRDMMADTISKGAV